VRSGDARKQEENSGDARGSADWKKQRHVLHLMFYTLSMASGLFQRVFNKSARIIYFPNFRAT
jgi:hypothetical protein